MIDHNTLCGNGTKNVDYNNVDHEAGGTNRINADNTNNQ